MSTITQIDTYMTCCGKSKMVTHNNGLLQLASTPKKKV